MFGGCVITGGVVSQTWIVNCTEEAALPRESDAEHATAVDPNGNTDPDAGTHETIIDESTASEATGTA
jgi:hypothetical protein